MAVKQVLDDLLRPGDWQVLEQRQKVLVAGRVQCQPHFGTTPAWWI